MAKLPSGAKKSASTTKSSEPGKVDEYVQRLVHPLVDVAAFLRRIILEADAEIGEEVKWNAPAFFHAGELPPSDPKEYRRYLVIFNLFKKDCVRLVFWNGAMVGDKSGFLEGDYADGRRLGQIFNLAEAKAKKKILQEIVRRQVTAVRG